MPEKETPSHNLEENLKVQFGQLEQMLGQQEQKVGEIDASFAPLLQEYILLCHGIARRSRKKHIEVPSRKDEATGLEVTHKLFLLEHLGKACKSLSLALTMNWKKETRVLVESALVQAMRSIKQAEKIIKEKEFDTSTAEAQELQNIFACLSDSLRTITNLFGTEMRSMAPETNFYIYDTRISLLEIAMAIDDPDGVLVPLAHAGDENPPQKYGVITPQGMFVMVGSESGRIH